LFFPPPLLQGIDFPSWDFLWVRRDGGDRQDVTFVADGDSKNLCLLLLYMVSVFPSLRWAIRMGS